MSEGKWLLSTNPSLMIFEVWSGGNAEGASRLPTPFDTKARFVSCACCRTLPLVKAASDVVRKVEEIVIDGSSPLDAMDVLWPNIETRYAAIRGLCLSSPLSSTLEVLGRTREPVASNIIRDIFGNPWRMKPSSRPCTWRTREVLSLAQAVMDDREMTCPTCRGRGVVRDAVPYGELSTCEVCEGTKTVTRPTLDSTRLAILADAMEEAGCGDDCGPGHVSMEEDALRHLRGYELCRDCHHTFPDAEYGGGNYWCPRCGGTSEAGDGAGWAKNEKLDHYLGCWALEFARGRLLETVWGEK